MSPLLNLSIRSTPVKVLKSKLESPESITPLLLSSSTKETSRLYVPKDAVVATMNGRETELEPEAMVTLRSLGGSLRVGPPGNWMLAPNRACLATPGFVTL